MKSKKIIKKMFSSKKNRKITLKKTKQQQQKNKNSNTAQTQCKSFWKMQNHLKCLKEGYYLFTTAVTTCKRCSEIDIHISLHSKTYKHELNYFST